VGSRVSPRAGTTLAAGEDTEKESGNVEGAEELGDEKDEG